MNQYLRLAQQRVFLLCQFLFLVVGLGIGMCGVQSACAASEEPHERLSEILAEWEESSFAKDKRGQLLDELKAMSLDSPFDEVRAGALYFLGRVRDPNERESDVPEFRRLIAEFGDQPLAQLARLKLIIRRLYTTSESDVEDRLREAEKLGEGISQNALLSDFHLIMGDAYLFSGDQREPALKHFIAAEYLGIPSSATRATVLVQIGELARLTEDPIRAKESYQQFLTDFPRDIRQQIVRDRLAALEGGAL